MNVQAASGPRPVALIKGWATVSRIPFLSVGVMPYLLGAQIAAYHGASIRWTVFWFGLAGVVLIMLATYYNGEHADMAEDRISTDLGRNPFAGGSGGVIDGLVPARQTLIAANVVSVAAIAIGLVLYFVYHTGPWTLPIGIFGLLAGYFYSARPMRWVTRGIGEILIGICYGWLPVAIGYYLQWGRLPAILWWVSVPIGITIFNVIYDNEYPDYEGDLATGKRNLLVRVGRERGIWIYVAAVIASPLAYAFSLTQGVPSNTWPWFAAVTALSLIPTVMFVTGQWRKRDMLKPICGITILVNLATTGVLIAAFAIAGTV